ncbi:MAG TPA: HEPN domain-containing protein [bacterium]|nr:HEPN domain-containing protein [bacterium]
MKEEDIKLNIQEELKRAEDAFISANLLFENKLLEDAISRLYYFVLHSVKALLLTKGLEPRSHEGALRLLSLHFIKEGTLEPESAHIFSKLMKYREEADYNPSYIFIDDDFINFRNDAEKLVNAIKDYLRSQGYIG